MHENEIGKEVVDSALVVHRELGPGLLETVYEIVLENELKRRGFHTERQVSVSITCRGTVVDGGFRADMIINNGVIFFITSHV